MTPQKKEQRNEKREDRIGSNCNGERKADFVDGVVTVEE